MLQVYFAALAIFFVSLLVGCAFFKRSSGMFGLITWATIIIGALGFFIKWSSRGDFADAIIAAVVFAPVFLSGLGFLASSLIRKHQGKPLLQGAILGLFTIPAGVWAFGSDKTERAAEIELERFKAEMQQKDIGGTFGGHYITIPVAPLIAVETICDPPPGVSDSSCNGEFSSKISIDRFHGHGSTDLEFTYVTVNFPKCESARCTEVKDWCERRPALRATAWCQSGHSFLLRMSTDAIEPQVDAKHPFLEQTDPVEGLRIRCSDTILKGSCSAYFEVARGVDAVIGAHSIESGSEEATIREMLAVVEKIWSEMTLDRR